MSGPVLGPFPGIRLLGGAIALPPRALTTAEALASVPIGAAMSATRRAYVAEQLDDMLGLRRRHWSYTPGHPEPIGPDSAALAATALSDALKQSGVSAEQLGLVLVATSTPHRFTSTISCALGEATGFQAPSVDLRGGCAAGLFGLPQAAAYVQAGASAVALVGVDTFSAVIPPAHRLSACVMGDGATALIIGPGEGTLHAVTYETDGRLRGLVGTPGPMPPTPEAIKAGAYRLTGDPDAFNAEIPLRYTQAIRRALEYARMTPDAIDHVLPHQTSVPMLQEICTQSNLPLPALWSSGVAEHANIGAAGWMAALWRAVERGIACPGDTILSAAVGGGMSWGAAVWTL